MRSFLGRDILSLKDFERHDFMRIFQVAQELEPYARDRRNGDLLKHKTLVTAFYQPSTRTRLSTEAAMHRLGGHVVGFSDPKMTRAGDFYQLNLMDSLPIMVGVQAAGSAPLVRAWRAGAGRAEPMQPDTIADSISVGIPRDQVKALRAVRDSEGQFVAVSDAEILSAISILAEMTGVMAEPAGAAGLAGLIKLVEQGICGFDDRTVVMVTGNGLKDIEGVMRAVTREPVEVENSLEDVEHKLSGKGVRRG